MGGGVQGGRRLWDKDLFLISREWGKKISPAVTAMKHYGRVLIQNIYNSIPKLIPFSLHVSHWFDCRLNIQHKTEDEARNYSSSKPSRNSPSINPGCLHFQLVASSILCDTNRIFTGNLVGNNSNRHPVWLNWANAEGKLVVSLPQSSRLLDYNCYTYIDIKFLNNKYDVWVNSNPQFLKTYTWKPHQIHLKHN